MEHNTHTKRLDEWQLDVSLNDETAFRKMFERYYVDLCIFAKRYVSDLHTREDLVQDVFCAVWMNRIKIDSTIPIRNYLITSVKYHCLNYLRKSSKHEFHKEAEMENIPVYADRSDELYSLEELRGIFYRTLNSLPEEYRIAFEMSRMENKPSAEIAEKLGVSVRTVERYRNKAIEILKTELKDFLPLMIFLLSIRS